MNRKATRSILLALVLGFPAVAAAQTKALSSALVQVFGASPILLAPSRDADIHIRTIEGGSVEADFDKLADVNGVPINDAGATMELEILVNGVSDLRTLSFDIENGQADIEMLLGLATGDLVKIERIDFFDSGGDRFATLGVRIQNP